MYRTKITRKSDKAFSFSDFNIQNTSTAPLYTLEIEYPEINISNYLQDRILYKIDSRAREGLQLFLEKIQEIK